MTIFLHVLDLDKTLVRKNSSFSFFLYLIRKGQMPARFFFQALWFRWLFWRQRISLNELHGLVFFSFFKGRKKEDIIKEVEPFLDGWLEPMIDQKLLKKASGRKLLLSSSPDFLVGPIAERLGIDEWRASEYAVDKEGIFCEITKVVDGASKWEFTQMAAGGNPICAYSDSEEDRALLENADVVYLIRASRRLKKMAKENGWQIVS